MSNRAAVGTSRRSWLLLVPLVLLAGALVPSPAAAQQPTCEAEFTATQDPAVGNFSLECDSAIDSFQVESSEPGELQGDGQTVCFRTDTSGESFQCEVNIAPPGSAVGSGEFTADDDSVCDEDITLEFFDIETKDGVAPDVGPVEITGCDSGIGGEGQCHGNEATITGTARPDDIEGTSGRDVIDARGGDDVVHARGGNDLICGKGGNDRLFGQEGDDRIFGQGDRDKAVGGPGSDDLEGGDGTDIVLGRGGQDRLSGGVGGDTLLGGDGDDILRGNENADALRGNDGNDALAGDGGDDFLDGGPDRDSCRGGPGFDNAVNCEA